MGPLPQAQVRTRSEERRVGKSVHHRVDLGGRRIIKKKKDGCGPAGLREGRGNREVRPGRILDARRYALEARSSATCLYGFFFFKQKTAYEMVMSDWSSDVCSSDLDRAGELKDERHPGALLEAPVE